MKDDTILDITNDIKWIGILDPDLRTFDIVMETVHGTTYNSYFIDAQKKTIVETTKENDINLSFQALTDDMEGTVLAHALFSMGIANDKLKFSDLVKGDNLENKVHIA